MAEQNLKQSNSGNPPANYERYFVPAIGAPIAIDLIHRAELRPGERVLDVACGTGVVARMAAEKVGSSGTVAGLDLNPGMLEVARSVTSPELSIEWHQASAESMPLADASFDVVLCQMGLQFIPDKKAALCEMHRVLAPGGRLFLSVPGPTPRMFSIMGESLDRHVGAQAAGFVQQVFSLHDTEVIQSQLEQEGFHDVSVQAQPRELRLPAPEKFLWGYVQSTPLAGAVAQVDDEQRSALEQEVVRKWEELMDDGTLLLEVRMVLATARK